MFFYLSKIIWFFTAPTNALVGLVALGAALLFTRWGRLGRGVTALSAAGLVLIAATPLPKVLIRPIEDRFERSPPDQRPVDGIVVMGGSIGFARGEIDFGPGASRLTAAVDLARRYPAARVVFTGGESGLLDRSDETEAKAAGQYFRLVGLPPERVILEDASRNTRENALFTRRLVEPKPGERWLLVTSAFHMPRSIGCFRAVGLDLEPYPVDYRTEGDARDYYRVSRNFSWSLALADLTIREWIGLVAYRIAGFTQELLPGPREAKGTP